MYWANVSVGSTVQLFDEGIRFILFMSPRLQTPGHAEGSAVLRERDNGGGACRTGYRGVNDIIMLHMIERNRGHPGIIILQVHYTIALLYDSIILKDYCIKAPTDASETAVWGLELVSL